VREMISSTSLDGYEGCGRAIMRLDLLGKLSGIKTRTLFICGADDQGTPPSGMREMHRLVAGSRYIEIAPGAHLPNIEQPEAFNRALIDFLAEG
jgi:3-oxoadipate enol-lactonase